MRPSNSNLPEILLCGYERGGTTLLSDIFRSNGYESGFECGALLCSSPKKFKEFKPYIDLLYTGWDVTPQQMTPHFNNGFDSFYSNLVSEAFPDMPKGTKIFDKTPIYMQALGKCLNRTNFIKRAVVIYRDPRGFFVSAAKRRINSESIDDHLVRHIDSLTDHYIRYFTGVAAHIQNKNVLMVSMEDLCTREEYLLSMIGQFATGEPFKPRNAQSRFENVTSKSMDLSKVYEFEEYISESTQNLVLEKTKLAAMFFADPKDRVKYIGYSKAIFQKIDALLEKYDLPRYGCDIDGVYFEPFTYLLRHADVRDAGLNPIDHFTRYGQKESRNPA